VPCVIINIAYNHLYVREHLALVGLLCGRLRCVVVLVFFLALFFINHLLSFHSFMYKKSWLRHFYHHAHCYHHSLQNLVTFMPVF